MNGFDTARQSSGTPPLISVIMANYRGADHLPSALASVLAQTAADMEIIVSDDASPDASVEIVRQFMAHDPRVRLVETKTNQGPAAARNSALRIARGEWIAIVDSDDIIHPERFETLLAVAADFGADAVADDLLFFSDAGAGPTLLGAGAAERPMPVSAEFFIRSNTSGAGLPPLGYLKPIFRRSRIAASLYDETIRIAEDYDFMLRFLLDGGRLVVLPQPLYLYRRHSGSISHRLSETTVRAMIDNQQALTASRSGSLPPEIRERLGSRMKALRQAASFERLVASMKERQAATALKIMAANPRLILPLCRSASAHWRARLAKPARPRATRSIVLHDANTKPGNIASLHRGLGLPAAVEFIGVPRYRRPAGRDAIDRATRALWVRLAETGMADSVQAIGHGLAGLHAMAFLPRTLAATVIIEDGDEIERAWHWISGTQTQLVVTEAAMEAMPAALATRHITGPYHLVDHAGRNHTGGLTGAIDAN